MDVSITGLHLHAGDIQMSSWGMRKILTWLNHWYQNYYKKNFHQIWIMNLYNVCEISPWILGMNFNVTVIET